MVCVSVWASNSFHRRALHFCRAAIRSSRRCDSSFGDVRYCQDTSATPATPGPAAAINRINAATINTNCTKRLWLKASGTPRTPRNLHGYGGFCINPSLGYSHWCLFMVVQVEYFKSIDMNIKWVKLKVQGHVLYTTAQQLATEHI